MANNISAATGLSMKQRLRRFVDWCAHGSGFLRWYERRMQRGFTILMYHRVLPMAECVDYPLPALVMPVDAFREQMQWLAAGCRVVPVGEGMSESARQGKSVRPTVSVTFDDGYADNFEHASPILDECGIRATFFVTTGFVENTESMWFDRAADAWRRLRPVDRFELFRRLCRTIGRDPRDPSNGDVTPASSAWMSAMKIASLTVRTEFVREAESLAVGQFQSERYQPMSTQQIRSLHDRGHEIASHTVTHPILPQLDDNELRRELCESAATIQGWTGQPPEGFCYPNGDVDARVEKYVREAGYQFACTTLSGLNRPGVSRMRLSRLAMTMQRTVPNDRDHDLLGFRTELCRLREWLR